MRRNERNRSLTAGRSRALAAGYGVAAVGLVGATVGLAYGPVGLQTGGLILATFGVGLAAGASLVPREACHACHAFPAEELSGLCWTCEEDRDRDLELRRLEIEELERDGVSYSVDADGREVPTW